MRGTEGVASEQLRIRCPTAAALEVRRCDSRRVRHTVRHIWHVQCHATSCIAGVENERARSIRRRQVLPQINSVYVCKSPIALTQHSPLPSCPCLPPLCHTPTHLLLPYAAKHFSSCTVPVLIFQHWLHAFGGEGEGGHHGGGARRGLDQGKGN